MSRAACTVVAVALVGVMSSACAGAAGTVDQAGEAAGELSEQARFCFSLARAVTAVESGSPDTARQAAQELLARSPEDLVEDAHGMIDALEDARERGVHDLRDPRLRDAAERLREGARQHCDGTEGSS